MRAGSQRTNDDGQEPKMNWPRASVKGIWATVDLDLIGALDGLKGTTENKPEKMGDLICEYCMRRL